MFKSYLYLVALLAVLMLQSCAHREPYRGYRETAYTCRRPMDQKSDMKCMGTDVYYDNLSTHKNYDYDVNGFD